MPQRYSQPFLLAALVALLATPAEAKQLDRSGAAAPDRVRELLARAKEATGGQRWDVVGGEHLVASVTTGGMTGRLESWSDARRCRFVERLELGPMKEAGGYDGTRAWTADSSGQPRVEQGGDGREASVDEAFRRCFGYWYPDRWKFSAEDLGDRDEGVRRLAGVRLTPEGGRPLELWIDLATGLVDRDVEKTALDTRTRFYADYREVEGVKVPFAVRQTNGDPRFEQTAVVQSVTFREPVDPARFEVPAPPPPDFSLAAGQTSTEVPFELVNNHIFVDVKLNGRGPYRLLCDTGGVNVIVPEVAKELGLAAEGALQGRGTGEGSEELALAKLDSVQLGDATLKEQVFYVAALGRMEDVEGVPLIGLVGYEVFRRFVVRIDYQHRSLRLTVPAAFAHDGKGTVVPFRFNEHVPQVEGTLDGIPGAFDLDTGARGSLVVLAPFAEKHELGLRYRGAFEAVTSWGIDGPSRGKVARASLLTLGGVRIERPVLNLSLQKKGAFVDPYVAGNVGAGVLRRFTVTFDYGRQQVIFEPNEAYGLPDVFDRSGMWVNGEGERFVVLDVVARGPAAEAGLATGDRVVAVDGRPAREVSLVGFRERLRRDAPGTRMKLTVESQGGARRQVTLTLRDLV